MTARHGLPVDTYRVLVVPGGDGVFQVKGEGDHNGRWAIFLDPENDAGLLRIHGYRITALWNRSYVTSYGGLPAEQVLENRVLISRALFNLSDRLRSGDVDGLDTLDLK